MNDTETLAPQTSPLAPLALIDKAIERGLDPAQLTKLFDLQERWEKNRALEAFNTAMKLCQQEMPIVLKDCENTHTRSRYASREMMNKLIKPVYVRHGFSLSFRTEDCPRDGYMRIVCDMRHEAGHVEHPRIDLPIDGTGAKGGNSAMNPVQGHGSTFEYGCRYLTAMGFNVIIAEDTDGSPVDAPLSDDEIREITDGLAELHKLGLDTTARPNIDGKLGKSFQEWLWAWLGVKGIEECRQSHMPKLRQQFKSERAKLHALATLHGLIDDLAGSDNAVDMQKLLGYYKVKDLRELTLAQLEHAVEYLRKKGGGQ